MKYKTLILAAAIATLAASCNKSNNSNAVDTDTQSVEVSTEIVAVDTTVIEETPTTNSIVEEDAIAEKVDTPQADNNNLDGEVDKIIGQINEHIEVIQSCVDDGIPSSSSLAFRALENLPDYTKQLDKIKGKLTPEQKARIDAAEKKLNKVVSSWN